MMTYQKEIKAKKRLKCKVWEFWKRFLVRFPGNRHHQGNELVQNMNLQFQPSLILSVSLTQLVNVVIYL